MASSEEIGAGWKRSMQKMLKEKPIGMVCRTLNITRQEALKMVMPHIMQDLIFRRKTAQQIVAQRKLKRGELGRIKGMYEGRHPQPKKERVGDPRKAWAATGNRTRKPRK